MAFGIAIIYFSQGVCNQLWPHPSRPPADSISPFRSASLNLCVGIEASQVADTIYEALSSSAKYHEGLYVSFAVLCFIAATIAVAETTIAVNHVDFEAGISSTGQLIALVVTVSQIFMTLWHAFSPISNTPVRTPLPLICH